MKKLMFLLLNFILCLSVLSTGASAAGEATLENPNTGDMFSMVIAMLLVSAMGVAALVANKTRFDLDDKKKKAGK